MTHSVRVDDVEIRETPCRLLEIRASTNDELEGLLRAAERKGWSLWLRGSPASDCCHPFGAVLEKGMPYMDDPSELLVLEQFRPANEGTYNELDEVAALAITYDDVLRVVPVRRAQV